MPSTSTTAPIQPGTNKSVIWSRSRQGAAARRVLLVVTGATLVLPLAATPEPVHAKSSKAKSTKRVRSSQKYRTKRRSARKSTKPTLARKAPVRRMQVGGVLIRPDDHASIAALPQVQSSAIPSSSGFLIAQATTDAPSPAIPNVSPATSAESSIGTGVATPAPTADATPPSTPAPLAPGAPAPISAPVPGGDAVLPAPGAPVPLPTPLPDPAQPLAPAPALSTTPSVGDAAASETVADQAEALRGLGEIRRRQQRYNEAVDFFGRATLLDPGDIKARVGLAQSLRGLSKFQEALVESEKALALDPNNLAARVVHAQLLGDNDRPDDAARELNALVASLPEKPSPETYSALAQAFVSLRNYDTALDLLKRGKQDYPQDDLIARNTAEALTFSKRWDEALAAWDALIAIDAKDSDAYLGKARVYNYSSREDQAEPLYRKAIEISPDNYQAQVELADILGRRGNWAGAIEGYRTALSKNGGDLAARVELARLLRYSGRYAEADTEIAQVLSTDAKYAPAYTERGILRGQNKQYDLAIADLRRALDLTPTDVNAQFGLAEVLGYQRNYDESIRLYQKALEQEPDNQKGRIQLGLVLSYANRFDDSLRELNAVLAINPNNTSALIGKADTLARLRRYDESVAIYNRVLETDPANRRAITGMAEVYVYSKQYTKAIALYDRILATNPEDVSAAIDRGRALGYAGLARESLIALRPLVTSHPDNIDARLAYAEALTNSGQRSMRDEAIAQYRTILQSDPQNVDARFGLGRALGYQGRTREAEAELRQVIAARPQDADAYFALGEAQRYTKPFDAKDSFERALKLGPQGINARRASLALRDLRHETRPSFTISGRRYSDSNNVRLTEVGGGPTIRTRAGSIGVYGLTGRYQDEGLWQRRTDYGITLGKDFGSVRARLLLHRVQYAIAPDRTLFDLNFEKSPTERKRYYLTLAKREIIESLGATNAGITARTYIAGAQWPMGNHIDLSLEGRFYQYSVGNNRRGTISPAIHYRFKPTTPTLRLGLGYTYDDTRFLAPPATFFYTPQRYSVFSLLADYVKTRGRSRFGVYAAHPLSNSTGFNGVNRPADTLFGYWQYDLNELMQLFVQGGIVRGPSFDSNDIAGGVNIWF